MTIDEIPAIASDLADQIRRRAPPTQRVESTADSDIAALCDMVILLAWAVGDLVREQGRGR